MTCRALTLALIASLALSAPALSADKIARPLADLLNSGAEILAAGDETVWIKHDSTVYLCVVQISDRFRGSLRYTKPRILYESWPRAMCFNANSFE